MWNEFFVFGCFNIGRTGDLLQERKEGFRELKWRHCRDYVIRVGIFVRWRRNLQTVL